MPQKRLLFVVADNLIAYHWRSGELVVEGAFAANETGLAAFGGYLRQRRTSLFLVLADVAEESFHSHCIPYLRGRDRDALVTRKLAQIFHGTPYSTAIGQGREKIGRRDEKLLFFALTRPQQFAHWLAALRQNEIRLTGFYSLPMLAARLIDGAESAAPRPSLLLVCLTRGGLRQTFFDHGLLRFSRLSPLLTGSVEEAAIATANESAKLYQYLAGQQLIAPAQALTIQVLAHPADRPSIAAHCQDTDELHFETIDLLAKARQAGLKTVPTDSHSDLLFLHLLARKQPPQQLAALPERHFSQLGQLRLAINSAAAMILLGSVLWSGKQWFDTARLDGDAMQIQSQIAVDRQGYDSIMATLPPVPLSAENLHALIGRFDDLERHSASLSATYVRISHAMQEAPTIELAGIDWQVSANPEEGLQARNSNAATAATLASSAPGSVYAITDIHGALPAAISGDHRALLDTVNSFADRLRLDGALQVRILNMPFDVESGKTLRSDSIPATATSATSATNRFTNAPRFSLRLLQKI
jgi:hypothetical protein